MKSVQKILAILLFLGISLAATGSWAASSVDVNVSYLETHLADNTWQYQYKFSNNNNSGSTLGAIQLNFDSSYASLLGASVPTINWDVYSSIGNIDGNAFAAFYSVNDDGSTDIFGGYSLGGFSLIFDSQQIAPLFEATLYNGTNGSSLVYGSATPTPIPGAAWLLGSGLLGLAGLRRRRNLSA